MSEPRELPTEPAAAARVDALSQAKEHQAFGGPIGALAMMVMD